MNYSDAAAWAAGPDHVYRLLARAAIGLIPEDLSGKLILDAGAGTVAASVFLRDRGSKTVACDGSSWLVVLAPRPRPRADRLDQEPHVPLRWDADRKSVAEVVAWGAMR